MCLNGHIWPKFGATILPATVTTPAPTAATTTPTVIMASTPAMAPTMICVTSSAVEFNEWGQWSSSDNMKFQNPEQWLKWHRALMGNAYEHKCEQVVDPSYVPNSNNPNKIALFGLQQ